MSEPQIKTEIDEDILARMKSEQYFHTSLHHLAIQVNLWIEVVLGLEPCGRWAARNFFPVLSRFILRFVKIVQVHEFTYALSSSFKRIMVVNEKNWEYVNCCYDRVRYVMPLIIQLERHPIPPPWAVQYQLFTIQFF